MINDGIAVGKVIAITAMVALANWNNKQYLVIQEESAGDYPNSLTIEFYGEKMDKIYWIKVGDTVEVGVAFKSREYNGTWYNSVSWWRVNKTEKKASPNWNLLDESIDDLPF